MNNQFIARQSVAIDATISKVWDALVVPTQLSNSVWDERHHRIGRWEPKSYLREESRGKPTTRSNLDY
jgi:hypothetical protein